MKQFARNFAVMLLTLAVILLIWQFRSALILFLLSLWFAAAARPVVIQLEARGIKRALAITLVYLVVIAVFVGIFIVAGPSLIRNLRILSDTFVVQYNQMWQEWPQGTGVERLIISQLPDPRNLYDFLAIQSQNPFFDGFMKATFGSIGFISQLGAALILSIFWTSDRVRFERLWLSLLPANARMRARSTWRDIEEGVGAYTRSEILQGILAGLLLGVGLSLMRVPFSTLLALVGGVAWLVPWVGIVGTLGLVFLSAATVSLQLAILASGFTFIVLLALELFVEPYLFNRDRLSSLLVLLFAIALTTTIGMVGLVIAPALAATVQLVGRNMQRRPAPILTSETVGRFSELDRHLEQLRSSMGDEPKPQMENIVTRLTDLVEKSKEVMQIEKDRGMLDESSDASPYPGRVSSS